VRAAVSGIWDLGSGNWDLGIGGNHRRFDSATVYFINQGKSAILLSSLPTVLNLCSEATRGKRDGTEA
jgi:hypothetical protein